MGIEATEAGTPGGNHSFRLNDFEGPLDLLLYLIRKNEININDIPIAAITEQYIDYLRNAETLDLNDVTEFYAMASMLLLIKSRTLLPVELDDDSEIIDPRKNLVEQLIEYQKFKKLTELMEDKETEWMLERRKLQYNLPFTDADLWEKVDVWNLMKAFAAMVRNLPGEGVFDTFEEISVNEKVTLLYELLENKGECRFTDLVIKTNSIMDIVCSLLAVLEAVKVRMIIILQNRMFGDILIKPAAIGANNGR